MLILFKFKRVSYDVFVVLYSHLPPEHRGQLGREVLQRRPNRRKLFLTNLRKEDRLLLKRLRTLRKLHPREVPYDEIFKDQGGCKTPI